MRRFGFFLFPAAVVLVAVLLVARVTAFPRSEAPASQSARVGPCDVEFVTGADSLDVRCDSQSGRVRLIGLDSPERGARGFERASAGLRSLVGAAGSVTVHLAPGVGALEPGVERAADVYDGHGRNLSAEMIRRGWSRYRTLEPASPQGPELAAAEIEARVQHRGVWAAR